MTVALTVVCEVYNVGIPPLEACQVVPHSAFDARATKGVMGFSCVVVIIPLEVDGTATVLTPSRTLIPEPDEIEVKDAGKRGRRRRDMGRVGAGSSGGYTIREKHVDGALGALGVQFAAESPGLLH